VNVYNNNNKRGMEALAHARGRYTPLQMRDLELLLQLGYTGELSEAAFHSLSGMLSSDYLRSFVARDAYTSSVSWAVHTEEWQEDLRKLVARLTSRTYPAVLEIGAGRGLLGAPMRKRGLKWVCTDIDPALGSDVQKMGALIAVRSYLGEIDVVFASWIPYEAEWDLELANLCADNGLPLVIVGESGGGCTGSEALWGYRSFSDRYDDEGDEIPEEDLPELPERRFKIEYVGELMPGFRDVPQWDGIRDHTYCALPEKGSTCPLRGGWGL